jgi:hypothetical protein
MLLLKEGKVKSDEDTDEGGTTFFFMEAKQKFKQKFCNLYSYKSRNYIDSID